MNGRNRAPIPPAEDTSSPYFIHPSDNPGVVLVPQPLIGSNYSTWSRSFIIALLAKNKLVFVDGSILRPNGDDLLHQAWIRCNSMVVAWLRNSVSPQICSSIMFLDNAYEIWSDLKDRFSLGDSIRSNILAITPLPPLSKVFSLVIQEERQRRIDGKVISSTHSSTQAPVMSEQPFSNAASSFGRGYNKFLCSHCGKTDHIVDKCFFRHGFPPGYGRDKPKPAGFAQSSSYKPPGFAQSSSYKHKFVNYVEDNSDSSHWKGAQPIANLPTMDQYQQLVNLLQSQFHTQISLTASESAQSPQPLTQSQSTQSYNPFSGTICFPPSVNTLSSSCYSLSTWILDTDATHHVYYDPSLLSSASPISNASVNLPNGQTTPITHIGIVILTPIITLTSVLNVPSFSFNLLSVSALTKHASCTVTFTHNQFHIQEALLRSEDHDWEG
ncbi:uncharacterized protein LOC121786885 [Salvia splendens]|uniref:uncharacterized protein LOC121786885 n=1 Tax=Salvia splendens TaxID=180675 RepID=UPI001C266C06|nr:uncharacterized protein LOC121786885 [Salvia splendens]